MVFVIILFVLSMSGGLPDFIRIIAAVLLLFVACVTGFMCMIKS